MIFLLITLVLTGCNKKELKTNNNISKETAKIMLEKEIIHNDNIEKEDNEVKEELPEETKQVDEVKNIKENKLEEQTKKEEKKTENSVSNQTKIEKIDCVDIDECMNKSLPIQFEYQELIDNIFYLEIISQENKKLGYYIDYSFKPYTYVTKEECESKLESIKELLTDHIKEIKCDNRTLIITTNKEGEQNENS